MELELRGKTALVAGGASNIGRQITLALAAEGVRVALVDLDGAQADKVAALANAAGGTVSALRCDCTDRDAVASVATQAVAQLGHIDILVNCIGWAEHLPFLQKDWSGTDKEMAINFWTAINMTRAVLPYMVERNAGRVICVNSDAGKNGENREVIYSAAKAGIQGFVRALCKEVGRHNITVNGVCPSMTVPESDEDVGTNSMHYKRERPPELMERIVKLYPLRRVGRPSDVANLVVFLASAAGAFITGQNISVNGGFLTQ